MIIISVQFTFAEKDVAAAESSLRELRDASRKEPGVLQYDVARADESPNLFVLWEVYRDKGAIDAHLASEHFQRIYVNGIKSLVQSGGDIIRANPI